MLLDRCGSLWTKTKHRNKNKNRAPKIRYIRSHCVRCVRTPVPKTSGYSNRSLCMRYGCEKNKGEAKEPQKTVEKTNNTCSTLMGCFYVMFMLNNRKVIIKSENNTMEFVHKL